MAEHVVDAVAPILREIQVTQAEPMRMLKEQGGDIKAIRREMQEWQVSTATALGFAGHANIRIESLQKQIDALTERLDRLESQS